MWNEIISLPAPIQLANHFLTPPPRKKDAAGLSHLRFLSHFRCVLLFRFVLPIGILLALSFLGTSAAAQEPEDTYLLRVHHFLPPTSTTHADFLVPWSEKIEAESNGRLRFEIYPSMQLGGAPPQLYDQARDGVADIIWTLTGYTPGRFPMTEVFELPFMVTNAQATSQALQTYYEVYARREFADVHPLVLHVHDRGSLHMRKGKAITQLVDFQGSKIRAPSRLTNLLLERLGASSVGMPVPQVPQALSKGVVDGAILPFEVASTLKIHELVESHTLIEGERGLYTSVFLLAMNKQSYENLPVDLKAILDANSGMALARSLGRLWDRAEEKAKQIAHDEGNRFIILDADQTKAWQAAAEPVVQQWIRAMEEEGYEGDRLYQAAKKLIERYSQTHRTP